MRVVLCGDAPDVLALLDHVHVEVVVVRQVRVRVLRPLDLIKPVAELIGNHLVPVLDTLPEFRLEAVVPRVFVFCC